MPVYGNIKEFESNVGLGTSLPIYTLDVYGTVRTGILSVRDAYVLPSVDGSAFQQLTTDGAGNVTWATGTIVSMGSTIGGGTSESVLYIGAGGTLAQDPTYFSYDYINKILKLNDAGNNLKIGVSAGLAITSGVENTLIGYNVGMAITTANSNTAVGAYALESHGNGLYNTALGAYSLRENISGYFNVATGVGALYSSLDGDSNVAVGFDALYRNTSGDNNTVVGNLAGFNNISGSGNVFIGNNAGYYELGSDKLWVHNSDSIAPLIYGDFSTTKLGIGTSTPSHTFTVQGDGRFIGTLTVGNYYLPQVDGTIGQALVTDGTGNVTWATPASTTAVSIGSTIISGIPGAVLFIDSGGNLGQDQPNLFWNQTNQRLGIGTSAPSTTLGIAGTTRLYAGPGAATTRYTDIYTDINGDLLLNPTGTGIGVSKRMYINNAPGFGGNGEALSVGWDRTTAEILSTSPNTFEIHTRWYDSASFTTGVYRSAFISLTSNTYVPVLARYMQGMLISVYDDKPVYVTNTMNGISVSASIADGSTALNIEGGSFEAANYGTGIATNLYALRSTLRIGWDYYGRVDNAYGVHSRFTTTALVGYGGTVGNFYGYYLAALPTLTGVNVQSAYGLYLPNIGIGTYVNYAIYSAGGDSYFAGNVGIGSTTPTSKLDVAGKTSTADLKVGTASTAGWLLTAADTLGNATWAEAPVSGITTTGTGNSEEIFYSGIGGTITSNIRLKWFNDTGQMSVNSSVPAQGAALYVNGLITCNNIQLQYNGITTSYIVSVYDSYVLADASVGDITLTLPPAINSNGIAYKIKKVDTTLNNVFIIGDSGELIDGGSTYTISTPFSAREFVGVGFSWWVF